LNPGRSSVAAVAAVYAAAVVILTTLLSSVLNGRFFADDWEFAIARPAYHAWNAFFETHPYDLYRPIQLTIVAASQALLGPSTLPPHLVGICLHSLLILLCLRVLRALRASPPACWAAGGLLVSSQLNAPALGGNDTLSLVLGTLAGSAALWWMWPKEDPEGGRRPLQATAAFLVALFAKESSFGYLPILCALAWYGGRARRSPEPLGLRLAWSGRVVAVACGFLLWRSHLGAAGPGFGSPNGPFGLGRNLLTNPVMIGFAGTTPVSTTDVFTGVLERQWLWPLLGCAGAAVMIAIALAGFASRGGFRSAAWAVLAAGCTVGPILLGKHVSELYAYALLPYVAVGFGLGVDRLWRPSPRLAHAVLAALVAAVLAGNMSAAWRDARGMADKGRRAERLMAALLGRIRALPRHACLILVNPRLPRPDYSVYRMNTFRLTPGEELLRLSARADANVVMVDWPTLPARGEHPEAIFTLGANSELVEIRRAPSGPR
jgi:hypothetical protein